MTTQEGIEHHKEEEDPKEELQDRSDRLDRLVTALPQRGLSLSLFLPDSVFWCSNEPRLLIEERLQDRPRIVDRHANPQGQQTGQIDDLLPPGLWMEGLLRHEVEEDD